MLRGPFRNRVSELAAIRRLWAARGPQFLVAYGRRRVGKTALLRQAVRDRRHVFLTADTQSESALLDRFARECSRSLGPPGLAFRDWDGFFEFLEDASRTQETVVILDEVGFLHEASPAFFSVLQRHWDSALSGGRIRLVLCGSSVSAMERHVLGYRSPLYGRRTGQMEVLPLPYEEARRFFPRVPEARRVEFYAVLGGVPAYLLQFDPRRDVLANIEARVFPTEAYLHREPRLLLLQELRQPATYFSVLTAIAEGATRFNEIGQRGGLTANTLGKYLGVLREMRLVRRELPATERRLTPRRSHYRLADPFFAFWFRFVAPWSGAFDSGQAEAPKAHLRAHWPEHVGLVFEEVCRDIVRRHPEAFGGPWERVGSWWSGEAEVDVVAVDAKRKALLLGECQWTRERMGADVPAALEEKRQLLGKGWAHVGYALFSKTGFTSACREAAAVDTSLWDLEGLRRLVEGEREPV
jgi:hypothetical protein